MYSRSAPGPGIHGWSCRDDELETCAAGAGEAGSLNWDEPFNHPTVTVGARPLHPGGWQGSPSDPSDARDNERGEHGARRQAKRACPRKRTRSRETQPSSRAFPAEPAVGAGFARRLPPVAQTGRHVRPSSAPVRITALLTRNPTRRTRGPNQNTELAQCCSPGQERVLPPARARRFPSR